MFVPTLIRSGDVREEVLPPSYGDWADSARFAVRFEPRSRAEAAELGNWAFGRWQRTGELPRRIDELRACLWFEYRRWRFHGRTPDAITMRYCAATVRAIRSLL